MILWVEIQIYNTPLAEFNFLESQILLFGLFNSVDPKLTLTNILGVAHRHSYLKNYVLKVTKVSDFTTRIRAVKLLPT